MTNNIVVQHRTTEAHRFAVLFFLSFAVVLFAVDLLWMRWTAISFDSDSNLSFLFWFTLIVLGLALIQFVRLTKDGPTVARMFGGTMVELEPKSGKLTSYRNLASEVVLAAGMPMPQLFVMEDESRINAFAAGQQGQKVAICVTEGALDKLSPEQLQGVIAHEMAHLKFNDVRLSKWLSSGIFALVCLAALGLGLMWGGSKAAAGGNKESGAGGFMLLVVGLAILLVGGVGYIAAGILDAAVSREIEFRADAEAVRMLSTSKGLVGALIKLAQEAGDVDDDSLSDRLGFANPLCLRAGAKKFWFDTHPPLVARIKALDPSAAAAIQLTKGG